VKRLLIVVVIAVMLTAAFAVPVFADKPADPGGFGTAMAFHNAQGSLGPGASYEIQMAGRLGHTTRTYTVVRQAWSK
jgi:hypothetical protein